MNTNRKSLYANNLCGCVLTFLILPFVFGFSLRKREWLSLLGRRRLKLRRRTEVTASQANKEKITNKKCGCSCLSVCYSIVRLNRFDDDDRWRSTTRCLFSRWNTSKSRTKILIWTSADKASKALHEITFAINQLNV